MMYITGGENGERERERETESEQQGSKCTGRGMEKGGGD